MGMGGACWMRDVGRVGRGRMRGRGMAMVRCGEGGGIGATMLNVGENIV